MARGSNRSSGRWLTRAALVIVLVVIAARRCDRPADRPDSVADVGSPTPEETYRPAVDEGLGVAVAILLDNSGSMRKRARGDAEPKYVVARSAVENMLAVTDSFVAAQPDFPVKVGLYSFSSRTEPVAPIEPYNRERLRSALASIPRPDGGTAIGDAMEVARADLYRAGMIRKYLLIITDGENTDGREPDEVAREIARRSEGAVRMHFVAFDIEPEKFGFVTSVRGEVLGAADGGALRAGLQQIYRGKILAEAVDAGETLPTPTTRDTAARGMTRESADVNTSPRTNRP